MMKPYIKGKLLEQYPCTLSTPFEVPYTLDLEWLALHC